MNMQETFKLLTTIESLYPGFEKPKGPAEKIWTSALGDKSFEECFEILTEWAKGRTTPPKLCDFSNSPKDENDWYKQWAIISDGKGNVYQRLDYVGKHVWKFLMMAEEDSVKERRGKIKEFQTFYKSFKENGCPNVDKAEERKRNIDKWLHEIGYIDNPSLFFGKDQWLNDEIDRKFGKKND